jgi:formylglycine-generating enzyme required for sulfatase activity
MTAPDPNTAAAEPASHLPEALRWLLEHSEGGLTSRELAELLWLVPRLPVKRRPTLSIPASEPRREREPKPAPSTPQSPPPVPPSPEPPATAPDPFAPEVFPAAPAAEPAGGAELRLPLAVVPDPETVAALQATLPVRLAQAPPLGDRAELLRALRPLLRRRPDPHRSTLDEERTAEAWAQTRVWRPVMRPARTPFFDEVVVLVDAGLSMRVWHGLARELAAVLASSQVFPRVRLANLAPERLPAAPVPLGDGVLLLLLSDAAGPHWWEGGEGRLFAALERWCRRCPLTILQLLPPWQWDRTALSVGERVALRNGEPAAANRAYGAERLDWWDDEAPLERAAVVPVIPLDRASLAPWSAVVMGEAGHACGGVALPGLARCAERLAERLAEEPPRAPEERWARFCASATPQAQRLLMVLATAPVLTLPVIGLLKEAKVHGTSSPLPVAEALMSGMVQPLPDQEDVKDPDLLQFRLDPEVAALLVERLTEADRLDVIRTVSALVERRWNSEIGEPSFAAVLLDPTVAPPDGDLGRGLGHFASLTARLLDTLPGEEARAFAERLRGGSGLAPRPRWPAAMRFEERGFEAARLVEVPALEPIRVEAARFVAQELERIRFTTAWLEPIYRVVEAREEIWGFHEPLPGHPLALIQIPAGTFWMGSPREEVERISDEGPQHEVSLASFFLSQTPITQAQWREVAGWEAREGDRWGLALKPNPSWFQSQEGTGAARLLEGETNTDQRPVENVSWEEAMEFCARLSQRTGRSYTLPSEVQWEYACRAGTTTPFHFGETLTSKLANYDATDTYANGPKGEYREQTTPVGMFPANAWGLQDMHGNVLEWCLDHWHDSYEGAPTDGSAWVDGEGLDGEQSLRERLLRGGSWFDPPQNCRSAYRFRFLPVNRGLGRGFRVCCLPQD